MRYQVLQEIITPRYVRSRVSNLFFSYAVTYADRKCFPPSSSSFCASSFHLARLVWLSAPLWVQGSHPLSRLLKHRPPSICLLIPLSPYHHIHNNDTSRTTSHYTTTSQENPLNTFIMQIFVKTRKFSPHPSPTHRRRLSRNIVLTSSQSQERPSPLRLSPPTPSTMSSPRSKTRRVFLRTSNV